jgi:Holliday junction resolvase-like predicted endonuclease
MKKYLESEIQAKCIKYAQEQGWIVLKVISSNMNGISDLILFKDGRAVFVEIKGEKTRVQPLQLYRQKQFREAGFLAEIVRSLDEFKSILI